MDASEQRDVDKAHGALGMAVRNVEVRQDAVHRLEQKLEDLRLEQELTVKAIAEAKAALSEAQAELSVREANPLLAWQSSKGETYFIDAEPAEGTGS